MNTPSPSHAGSSLKPSWQSRGLVWSVNVRRREISNDTRAREAEVDEGLRARSASKIWAREREAGDASLEIVPRVGRTDNGVNLWKIGRIIRAKFSIILEAIVNREVKFFPRTLHALSLYSLPSRDYTRSPFPRAILPRLSVSRAYVRRSNFRSDRKNLSTRFLRRERPRRRRTWIDNIIDHGSAIGALSSLAGFRSTERGKSG